MRLCVRALVCVSVWVCWCWWGICAVCCDLLHSCARFYKCNAPHYGTPPWSLFLAHAYAKFRIFCPANMSQCVCGGICVSARVCVYVWRSSRINIPYGVIFLSFVLYALHSFKVAWTYVSELFDFRFLFFAHSHSHLPFSRFRLLFRFQFRA